MSILYLIRHGQASFGANDYDHLSDQGRRQARAAGDFFVGAGIRFDACWSGTLKRQRQTVHAVEERFRQAGMDMPRAEETASLNEYDYETVLRTLVPILINEDPNFQQAVDSMLDNRRAFQVVFGRVMRRWASGRDDLEALPAWSSYCRRVAGTLETVMQGNAGGRHVAVFTSGGPIAAMVGQVLELAAQATIALSWQLVNASVTRIRFSREQFFLATFNEHGFLETRSGHCRVTHR